MLTAGKVRFRYACPSCGKQTRATAKKLSSCPSCGAALTKPPATSGRTFPRNMGATVTACLPDGTLFVRTAGGNAIEALTAIVSGLPEGATVESISTHRTILRDLKGPPRVQSFHDRHPDTGDTYAAPSPPIDPWAVERALLARIGRTDLLPERMQRAPFRVRQQPTRPAFALTGKRWRRR